MKLAFFGAARQVTGSCYYVESNGLKVVVDCGLYQERPFLERNWAPFPVPAGDIDVLLLTHAHLDHSGLIPKVVREGFTGTILTTAATADLMSIALMDSAKIQEEDAAYKRKRHQKEGRTGRPAHSISSARTMASMARTSFDSSASCGTEASRRSLPARLYRD